MKSLRFVLPLLAFVILSGFLFKGLFLNPREVPSPLINKAAPAFELPIFQQPDKTLSGADLRGQPYVLNVFASWCGPCRQEHPLVIDLARKSAVKVYGLNYKDKEADAAAWLREMGDPYAAILVDLNGRAGIDWGVYGVPETFVVDGQGVVRLKHIGPLTPEVIQKQIEPLLQQLKG